MDDAMFRNYHVLSMYFILVPKLLENALVAKAVLRIFHIQRETEVAPPERPTKKSDAGGNAPRGVHIRQRRRVRRIAHPKLAGDFGARASGKARHAAARDDRVCQIVSAVAADADESPASTEVMNSREVVHLAAGADSKADLRVADREVGVDRDDGGAAVVDEAVVVADAEVDVGSARRVVPIRRSGDVSVKVIHRPGRCRPNERKRCAKTADESRDAAGENGGEGFCFMERTAGLTGQNGRFGMKRHERNE